MPIEMPGAGGNSSKVKGRVVVIDAGHGGYQSGAAYGGIKEKDLNLDISKILNTKLKELGIVTYMTRDRDIDVSLYSRSGLANSKNADLLISIHNNAGMAKTNGSMSLYYPSSSKTKGNLSAYGFAKIVQKNMCNTLDSKDMGVIGRSGLAVLRTSNMPAVIAEVGYMSNPTELSKLNTWGYKEKAAEGLKKAIVESLEKMYK
jgi:N-acetylmuramoyl-L-alanine amidase